MKLSYKVFFLVIVLVVNIFAFTKANAQTRVAFGFSQTAAKDWKQGDTQAFEINTAFDTKHQFKIDTLLLSLNLKFALGGIMEKTQENSNTNIIRPTDNELSGEAILKYPLSWNIDPFISASFLTQVTESFRIKDGAIVKTATIWDPVISQQALGFSYGYSDTSFKVISRLGVSLRQIRANKYTHLTHNPNTPEIQEKYKAESGIQIKAEASWKMNSTTNFKGTIETFGTFDDLSKWTLKNENELQVSLWKAISILLKIDLIYDEAQMLGTQYRQHLRFGLVWNF